MKAVITNSHNCRCLECSAPADVIYVGIRGLTYRCAVCSTKAVFYKDLTSAKAAVLGTKLIISAYELLPEMRIRHNGIIRYVLIVVLDALNAEVRFADRPQEKLTFKRDHELEIVI